MTRSTSSVASTVARFTTRLKYSTSRRISGHTYVQCRNRERGCLLSHSGTVSTPSEVSTVTRDSARVSIHSIFSDFTRLFRKLAINFGADRSTFFLLVNNEKNYFAGERYSPYQDVWHKISGMFCPRSNFASVVLDDMIFVVGGFNGTLYGSLQLLRGFDYLAKFEIRI